MGATLLALVATIVVTKNRGAGLASARPPVPAQPAAAAPPLAGAAGIASPIGGPSPDLSAMTPVARFDTLFDQVMRASEGGDAATVATTAPMALAAFGLLDAPDVDARFHAGLNHLANGDAAGATTQADAIAREQPAHLFGIMLKGRIAERNQDTAALTGARRAFMAAYPAETAAQRPEYPGHQVMIDRFLKDAAPSTP